ncbi:MAG: ABC transporter substrate-binding protein [Gammaproteobacteria bacterium]|nr:ABC transporter substrate-binding protein [Gammaproteobacteria bacterium]
MQTNTPTALYRFLSVLTLLGLLYQSPLSAATEPASDPRTLVIATSENLVAALQKNKAAIKQDMDLAYRLAEDTVIPQLDFPRITRWVLGKHWRAATDDQRQRLTREFRTLLTRSYVTAMVTYVDQILQNADNVQFPPARSRQDHDTAVVTMLISLEAGQQVVVQYQMYLSDTGWKIYDVQVEGMSLALTYRSTFSQEIAHAGIDGLIATLAARNRLAVREPLPQLTP